MEEYSIPVLDSGFVTLLDYPTNSDLMVVNAARVSFNKKKEKLDNSDRGLIDFLVRNHEDSPFRHPHITFRIKAPEYVMRQWYKHIVGIEYTVEKEKDHAWNEVSGRYVEYDYDFNIPKTFRQQSSKNKQATIDEEVEYRDEACKVYENCIQHAYSTYKKLINLGVGKEVARTVLPLNYFTKVIWTCSLQAALNFIYLRDHDGAQVEIRQYAKAIRQILEKVAPVTLEKWEKYRL